MEKEKCVTCGADATNSGWYLTCLACHDAQEAGRKLTLVVQTFRVEDTTVDMWEALDKEINTFLHEHQIEREQIVNISTNAYAYVFDYNSVSGYVVTLLLEVPTSVATKIREAQQ